MKSNTYKKSANKTDKTDKTDTDMVYDKKIYTNQQFTEKRI